MDQQNSKPVDAALRRRQTNVKAAQGIFFLSLIMSAVYLIRVLLRRNFNFFFCWFLPEALMKSAAFTQSYDTAFYPPYSDFFTQHILGKLPGAVCFALGAAILIVAALLAFYIARHPKVLWLELLVYGLDTALLLCGRLCSIPEPASQNGWIDVIFHAIILLLLIIGTVSQQKLPDHPETETK